MKDDTLQMTGGGRLVGLVVDGKHTPFSEDPVQRDDSHHSKENQLQHADVKNLTGGDYTKIVFVGSEREVLGLYGDMIEDTIEINNQDQGFGLLRGPNSNTFNSEMKEQLENSANRLGISDRLGAHDAWGWDIGNSPDKLTTKDGHTISSAIPMEDIRTYVDNLEQAAASQWNAIKTNGVNIDLNTTTPNISTFSLGGN